MQWMHTHINTRISRSFVHLICIFSFLSGSLSQSSKLFSLLFFHSLLTLLISCNQHRFLLPTFFLLYPLVIQPGSFLFSVFFSFPILNLALYLSASIWLYLHIFFLFFTRSGVRACVCVSLRFFFNVCLICIGRVDFFKGNIFY